MSDQLSGGDRFLIALALLILVFVGVNAFGAARGRCHDPDSQGHSEHNAANNDCAVNGMITLVGDVGTFIHARRDDLTAISTAVIAAFTVVLALVTRRQARLTKLVADAAKVSAAALPALERAYLFVSFPLQAATGRDSSSGDIVFAAPYTFRNHGKTVAVITGIGSIIGYHRFQPREMPISADIIPTGLVVAADGADSFAWNTDGHISVSDFADAKNGFGYILFIGRVVYDDVFGNAHETWFCREYNFEKNDFTASPNFDLNRRT